MQSAGHAQVQVQTAPASKAKLWTGRIMSGLVIAFLAMDVVGKFVVPQPVVEGMAKLGWPAHLSVPVGVILLICVTLYAIPRTAIVGAILLTAYFGGAVATHMRVQDPLFSHILFPVYMGILAWGGLFCRYEKVRVLFTRWTTST